MVNHPTNYKDMSGQTFGRLTVMEDSGIRIMKRVLWRCLCQCGKISLVSGQNLRNGNTKSCGCLSNEVRGFSLRKEKIGLRYGRLTVVGLSKNKKGKHRVWLCKCDCGKFKEITGSDLQTNHTLSCGCLQLESRTGGNSHLWKGGISKYPYHIDWNGTLRKKIRERDNYTCQLCGVEGGSELCIHHIDYNKQNINEFNLITLCRPCHTKTNHFRNKWVFPLQIKSGYWECFE